MKENRKMVRISREAHSYLSKISELSGLPMHTIVEQYVTELALICASFKKLAIWLDSSVAEDSISVRVVGSKIMFSGSIEAEHEEKKVEEIRKKLESESERKTEKILTVKAKVTKA